MALKEKIDSAPDAPGVYIIKSFDKSVIYIGKASSIKRRLKNHFCKRKVVSNKEAALAESVADIDYILTPDESTALLLEAALIKRYRPRYNVMLRDDKSYPRLKLTINEEYPRLFITRKIRDDGALYFGPYTNAKLLRKAVSFMKRIFPLRTCKVIPKKECLNFHIGQCLAPCMDNMKKIEYLNIIDGLRLFLEGKREELLHSLTEQMRLVSENKDYEQAARIRDRIKALAFVVGGKEDDTGTAVFLKERISPSVNQQLAELRLILNLNKLPVSIEAFDVSNIAGKGACGSMVYFKDGKPDKARYRKFKIKTVDVIDDYRMMRELISRRYKRLIDEAKSPSSVTLAKEDLPELIIIDGGKGHLLAAKKELHKLGLWNIPVISIAKNPDKIYVSEDKEPILLGKFEAASLFIQRIRDEAHRFAIDYHRLLHRKLLSVSELDNIKGIGIKRKESLIRYFGSLDEIKEADVEDLKKVRFINEKEAKAIHNYFRGCI